MKITLIEFQELVESKSAEFVDPILKSLYLIKQDQWDEAHDIAQDVPGKFGNLVHGLLHRIEGDQWNAAYWYRQSGIEDYKGSIEEEWLYIAGLYLTD